MNVDALAAAKNDVRPLTGAEYLECLRHSQSVFCGERVADVTNYPAFRNSARMAARRYDALHRPATTGVLTCPTDTRNGGLTHRFFQVDRSAEEVRGSPDSVAQWARITYGWNRQSPDYKASFTGTLGANSQFHKGFEPDLIDPDEVSYHTRARRA